MFARLFAAGGLSLDRLRALLEVSAAGSISKAAGGDAVKQSQFSRQIKELEDFFAVKLIERHGRGVRLTANGKELARIGRFFLLGLSNFQRGCLADEQTFRIAASPTALQHFVVPLLVTTDALALKQRFSIESVPDAEIESRLHDLTLDFGIVTAASIARPLKLRPLGEWRLDLWVPRRLSDSDVEAREMFAEGQLPLVLATELAADGFENVGSAQPFLRCADFQQAAVALQTQAIATLLPDFMHGEVDRRKLRCIRNIASVQQYQLAWNPRSLRLNPAASRVLDFLCTGLSQQLARSQRN